MSAHFQWPLGATLFDLEIPKTHTNSSPSHAAKPIVLLFSDDSTLFFCLRMRKILQSSSTSAPIEMAWYADETALSYRQMAQLLPEGPDRVLDGNRLALLAHDPKIQAIITSRIFKALHNKIKPRKSRLQARRPCILAFLGGLDFTPEQGFKNRRHCDAVYVFPKPSVKAFTKYSRQFDEGWQEVGFGHPHFLTPRKPPNDVSYRRDIYFFAQALSPATKRGRMHIIKILAAMARRYSDHTIRIKLRHLETENKSHLHHEKYSYATLLSSLPDAPDNLKLTACTMDKALAHAKLGITCTSTAAIDIIRSGIPAMVYLDYQDNYRDPLNAPMEKLFRHSGIITPLPDLLNLKAKPAQQKWINDMFCPRDLGERILATIEKFSNRPFQIHPELL